MIVGILRLVAHATRYEHLANIAIRWVPKAGTPKGHRGHSPLHSSQQARLLSPQWGRISDLFSTSSKSTRACAISSNSHRCGPHKQSRFRARKPIATVLSEFLFFFRLVCTRSIVVSGFTSRNQSRLHPLSRVLDGLQVETLPCGLFIGPLHAVLSLRYGRAATGPAMSVARDEFLAPHDLSLETAVCFWN